MVVTASGLLDVESLTGQSEFVVDLISIPVFSAIAGLVTSVQHRVAKASGNQYGMITVEDFGGEITVMFMGKGYQEYSHALVSDSIVVVRGRVSMRDDGMNLHAVSMFAPDVGASLGSGPLVISVPEFRATTEVVSARPA